MSKKETTKAENPILVKALNLLTNELIAQGNDGEKVIEQAEKSGLDYILDFETSPNYNFIF